jgi:hypothetical protein
MNGNARLDTLHTGHMNVWKEAWTCGGGEKGWSRVIGDDDTTRRWCDDGGRSRVGGRVGGFILLIGGGELRLYSSIFHTKLHPTAHEKRGLFGNSTSSISSLEIVLQVLAVCNVCLEIVLQVLAVNGLFGNSTSSISSLQCMDRALCQGIVNGVGGHTLAARGADVIRVWALAVGRTLK